MKPYYQDDAVTLYCGDCLEVLRTLPSNSVDSIVTDPPYGLSFMGKKWDYDVPSVEIWAECLRVLKPGGHLLAFAGTRTQHRMAVRIEDAGFEIRDMIAWVYGSGFPKSLDVGKAIDKAAGAEREVVGVDEKRAALLKNQMGDYVTESGWSAGNRTANITAPATSEAQQWAGWGTALKPALEPITVARKPFPSTVAANVQAWGTGALNVDGCRVGAEAELAKNWQRSQSTAAQEGRNSMNGGLNTIDLRGYTPTGRWPANLIHDGSDDVVRLFPETGSGQARQGKPGGSTFGGGEMGDYVVGTWYGDAGSAARFFYCAKASKSDRDEGCEGMEERFKENNGSHNGREDVDELSARWQRMARNHHPTVKPTDLMRYLVRLVTPLGGTVLDPFMGSGSTGKGAVLEEFRFIGIEREADYVEIAAARIKAMLEKPTQQEMF